MQILQNLINMSNCECLTVNEVQNQKLELYK